MISADFSWSAVTGFESSPGSRIRHPESLPDGYRGKLIQQEWIDGIEVLRGWLYTSPRLTGVTKSLGFGSFALSASIRAILSRPKADVVIATSPPPTVGIPGMLAARFLGAPLVFDVRDIWPEAIAASGRLQSGTLIRFLESIERAIYRNASAVTVVTEGKRVRLIEKGVAEEKIAVIPNGVDLSRFEQLTVNREELLTTHGLDPTAFIVLYAGIFNPAQGLDVLLDASAASQGEVAPEFAACAIRTGWRRVSARAPGPADCTRRTRAPASCSYQSSRVRISPHFSVPPTQLQ